MEKEKEVRCGVFPGDDSSSSMSLAEPDIVGGLKVQHRLPPEQRHIVELIAKRRKKQREV
jgi:hypothetical protein